jgi:hypothetical protein
VGKNGHKKVGFAIERKAMQPALRQIQAASTADCLAQQAKKQSL